MAARIMTRQGCGRSGIPAITRPMCSIPTAQMLRSATSPGFPNNVCAAHAPSRRADTPDWCIPRLGSCAASRFTADGCRLCCSTPELSAIPKLARNGHRDHDSNRRACIEPELLVFYSLRMILTFEHGAVRELRLNRPPVNALAPELIAALLHSVQMAPREGKRALVLS